MHAAQGRGWGPWLAVPLFLGAVLASVLAAVGLPEPEEGPPEIRYGVDVCSRCHMVVSDARFVAAYRAGDGQAAVFDDLGEMALELADEPGRVLKGAWVKDFDTGEWLQAEAAWYLHSPNLHSPMGFNVAAFGSEDRARRAGGAYGGTVLRWDDLVAAHGRAGSVEARAGLDPQPHRHGGP